MGLALKRLDLRRLADEKFADAELLLQHRRFSSAYYLSGYAAELGLKACIAKQFSAEAIPDRAFVNQVHTHSIKTLAGLSGLSNELKIKEDADPVFGENFAIVAQWGPDVRYAVTDAVAAQVMVQALKDRRSGIFGMDQALLVNAGQTIVRGLDARGAGPRAAIWVLNDETDTWKLWLVPETRELDQRSFYRQIAEIVSENRVTLGDIDAADAQMVSEDHPAIEGLRKFVHIPGLGSARTSNNQLNGFFLQQGIILRMDV